MNAGVAYTIASGKLLCDFAEFQTEAERLLGRPVMTHELADEDVWTQLRAAAEEELRLEAEARA